MPVTGQIDGNKADLHDQIKIHSEQIKFDQSQSEGDPIQINSVNPIRDQMNYMSISTSMNVMISYPIIQSDRRSDQRADRI